ncbi:MAG: DNA gyrase C-terminal beta-propeller domain-containing protein [Rhodospirillales bacterium]
MRCPVDEIRIARRSTRGVRIFDVANGDRVVSVSPLREQDEVSSSDTPEGSEVTE